MMRYQAMLAILVPLGAALLGCSGDQVPVSTRDEAKKMEAHETTSVEAVTSKKADACLQSEAPALSDVWGRYVIARIERYRGGLTTPDSANEQVGKKVFLSQDLFQHDRGSITSPRYKMVCHDDTRVEGEVPTYADRSVSTFYGFGSDREVVWTLEIRGADSDRALFKFEVVPGENGLELWDTYDGWIYFLRPTDDDAGGVPPR